MPPLDLGGVARPVGDDEPAGVLLVPAERRHPPASPCRMPACAAGVVAGRPVCQAAQPVAARMRSHWPMLGRLPARTAQCSSGAATPSSWTISSAGLARAGSSGRWPGRGPSGAASRPRNASSVPASASQLTRADSAAATQDAHEGHGEAGDVRAGVERQRHVHHDRLDADAEQQRAVAAEHGGERQQQRAQQRADRRRPARPATACDDQAAGVHPGQQPQRGGEHDERGQRAAGQRPDPGHGGPPVAQQHAAPAGPAPAGRRGRTPSANDVTRVPAGSRLTVGAPVTAHETNRSGVRHGTSAGSVGPASVRRRRQVEIHPTYVP